MRTVFIVKNDGYEIAEINTSANFNIGDFVEDHAGEQMYTVTDIFFILSGGALSQRLIEVEEVKR